jgi:NAD(P)-dependent dehydrogenase (short-subunit alcohol dehydrogenase family)
MRFTDKVCVVTGGGSGIGRAACERFAAEGGKVCVVDLNEAHGNETVQAHKRAVKAFSLKPMSPIPRSASCD